MDERQIQTAERDKKVVVEAAQYLNTLNLPIQVVTGGTAGVPDIFASHSNRVVDVVSSEYLDTYKERTRDCPRSYWVAGQTQLQRRLAFQSNPDIVAALFIQGGKYTTHEIKLMKEAGKHVVVFSGSGGASGGGQAYEGWTYTPSTEEASRPYASTDPDADYKIIAKALIDDLIVIF